MEQRLQKALASAGIGSRRYCETLITAGRVSVNGRQIKDLGAKANPDTDEIRVDGKPISAPSERAYIVLNKPTGYVSTVSDPHAKHTVMDLVQGVGGRIYPVGRLDADSAGLLLLTNDGEFTQILTHPSHQVPKTYRVVARGFVPDWAGADLRKGVILEDGMTAPAEVEWVDYDEANNASIVDVTIHEGRNRQVRRMFDAIGYPVLALTRTRIGPVLLKGLAPGTWRKLHPAEVKALRDAADTAPPALPQQPEDRPEELANPRMGAPEGAEPRPDGRPAPRERSGSREKAGGNRNKEFGARPAAPSPKAKDPRGPEPPVRPEPPRRPDKPRNPGSVPPARPGSKSTSPAPLQGRRVPPPPPAVKPDREAAAREAARRLAAQLNATPDEEETPNTRTESKPHAAKPAGKRAPKRP